MTDNNEEQAQQSSVFDAINKNQLVIHKRKSDRYIVAPTQNSIKFPQPGQNVLHGGPDKQVYNKSTLHYSTIITPHTLQQQPVKGQTPLAANFGRGQSATNKNLQSKPSQQAPILNQGQVLHHQMKLIGQSQHLMASNADQYNSGSKSQPSSGKYMVAGNANPPNGPVAASIPTRNVININSNMLSNNQNIQVHGVYSDQIPRGKQAPQKGSQSVKPMQNSEAVHVYHQAAKQKPYNNLIITSGGAIKGLNPGVVISPQSANPGGKISVQRTIQNQSPKAVNNPQAVQLLDVDEIVRNMRAAQQKHQQNHGANDYQQQIPVGQKSKSVGRSSQKRFQNQSGHMHSRNEQLTQKKLSQKRDSERNHQDELESYTFKMLHDQKFREELVQNPLFHNLVKSNILGDSHQEFSKAKAQYGAKQPYPGHNQYLANPHQTHGGQQYIITQSDSDGLIVGSVQGLQNNQGANNNFAANQSASRKSTRKLHNKPTSPKQRPKRQPSPKTPKTPRQGVKVSNIIVQNQRGEGLDAAPHPNYNSYHARLHDKRFVNKSGDMLSELQFHKQGGLAEAAMLSPKGTIQQFTVNSSQGFATDTHLDSGHEYQNVQTAGDVVLSERTKAIVKQQKASAQSDYGSAVLREGQNRKIKSPVDKNKEYQMQLFQHIAAGGQLHVGSAFSPTDETTNLASDYVSQQAPQMTRETNSSSIANRNLFADVEAAPTTHTQHSSQQPRSKSSIPRAQPQLITQAPQQQPKQLMAQNQQQPQQQVPIFINHGDINININIGGGQNGSKLQQPPHLTNEQLSQIIYQNMINNPQIKTQSIDEQLQNFAIELNRQQNPNQQQPPQQQKQQDFTPLSKQKLKINMAKNFSPDDCREQLAQASQYENVRATSPANRDAHLNFVKQSNSGKNLEALDAYQRENIEQLRVLMTKGQHQQQSALTQPPSQMQNQHPKPQGNFIKMKKQSNKSAGTSIQPPTQNAFPSAATPVQGQSQKHPQPQNQTTISKQQLRKQVVQYYWQHLIQSYGMESKPKLDVKGKTINGIPQPGLIQPQSHLKQIPNPLVINQLSQSGSKQLLPKDLQAQARGTRFSHQSDTQQYQSLPNSQAQQYLQPGAISSNGSSIQSSSQPVGSAPGKQQRQHLNKFCQNCVKYRGQSYMTQKEQQLQQINDSIQKLQRQKSHNKSEFHSSNSECCIGCGAQASNLTSQNPNDDPSLRYIMQQQNYQQSMLQAQYNHFVNQYAQGQAQNWNWPDSGLQPGFPSSSQPQSGQQQHYLHLFDQFGQHSYMCKCFKQQKEQNQRMLMDPYQRLYYIQQVGMQERSAAQQHQKNASLSNHQNLNPKAKRKAIIISRMDSINQFIKKLNQLILITLKATDSINPLALGQIKKLGQEIGIKWQTYLDAKFIKSKDFVTFLKSKIYVLLNNLLMKNNVSLFAQVQSMSDKIQEKERTNAKEERAEKNEKSAKKQPPQQQESSPQKADQNALILNEELSKSLGPADPLTGIQQMNLNHKWLSQIQMYNLLKFKNLGFKFWVEYPTVYGNNFVVVRNVTKRRTWLTWVDFDPYEDKTEQLSYFYAQNKEKAIDNVPAKNQDDGESDDEHDKSRAPPIFPNIIFTQVRRIKIVKELMPHQMYNHIDGINQVATKCQLHRNMSAYAKDVLKESPANVMPETYIVELEGNSRNILEHEEFLAFQKSYRKDSWWIVKPGEDANRGHGIKVFNNFQKIKEYVSYEFNQGAKHYKTCIIQRYIENPYLIHRRKFDIRVFALLSYISNFEKGEGIIRGWFYEEGYVRTSCKEFSLQQGDNQYIHLTNDAVQKQSQDYGKYEAGNKMSYSDFDKLLIKDKDTSFMNKILPQIKRRVGDVFKAAGKKLIGEVRSDYNGFEWLGLDFMIDDDMNLQLIEVNTNPCLETQSCILLQRLIPQMLDQSLKVALDPFFGASEHQYLMNQEFVATEIKYSMVYEEVIENIKSTPTWNMDQVYSYSPERKTNCGGGAPSPSKLKSCASDLRVQEANSSEDEEFSQD